MRRTLEVRERLFRHECSIAIYRDSEAYLDHDPERESQLVKIPYCEDRLVAVLPPDHPLAHEKSISLLPLADESFCLIRQDTMPYGLCMRACREAGFLPNVVFSSHNIDAILDMVRKGNCVSLLFGNHVSLARRAGPDGTPAFSAIPVEPEIRTTVCLSYLKDRQLSPAAAHFIDCFKKARAEPSLRGTDSKVE